MKAYLHGGRAGKTCKVHGIQFIDGVAEIPQITNFLSKYYAVRGYAPDEVEEKQDAERQEEKEAVQEVSDEDERYLNEVVAQAKEELSKQPERLKNQGDFAQFGPFKAYVKGVTGVTPKGKQQAYELLAEHAEKHGLIFEDDR